MVNKNNFLSIRVFHEDEIKNFLNKILLIFRKYKLKMNYYKKKKKCLKNTILRSPHVNKTARDQIELYSIEYFFDISKNNNNLLNFFFIYSKKIYKFIFKD